MRSLRGSMLALSIGALACSGEGGGPAGQAPAPGGERAELLREAFEAIAANDYDAFRRLTITSADIGMSGAKIGPGRGSYSAGSLKPEQEKRQREQFGRAVAGGSGQIDFRGSRFVGAGTLVSSGAEPALPQGSYAFDVFSLVVEKDGAAIDTRQLVPRFKVVKWRGEWRLMRLVFE